MTTTAAGTNAGAPASSASQRVRRGLGRELVRAGAAPLICALVLIVLLAAWAVTGGGGTLSRIRIRITQAAVPMLSYTNPGAAGRTAPVYLTLHNLSGNEDVLLSASSPDAARVELTTRRGAPGGALSQVIVPAGGTVSLSPFGQDLVLIGPKPLMAGQQVQLVLRFRNAGAVTVEATVTPPGTP
jgi:copper(I)-binding protein